MGLPPWLHDSGHGLACQGRPRERPFNMPLTRLSVTARWQSYRRNRLQAENG